MKLEPALILHHGFDAGNFAAAYTSTDLETAWAASSDEDNHQEDLSSEESTAIFRAGFVLGFFSSYELEEILEDEEREEYEEAKSKYESMAAESGLAL